MRLSLDGTHGSALHFHDIFEIAAGGIGSLVDVNVFDPAGEVDVDEAAQLLGGFESMATLDCLLEVVVANGLLLLWL